MPVEAAAGLRLTSLSKNWNDWKERGQGQRICRGKESARPRMSVQILVNGIVAEVISRRILSVARTYQSYVPRGHQLRLITCSLRASSLHECRMD